MMCDIYGLFLRKLNLSYRYVTNGHVSCLRTIVHKSQIFTLCMTNKFKNTLKVKVYFFKEIQDHTVITVITFCSILTYCEQYNP